MLIKFLCKFQLTKRQLPVGEKDEVDGGGRFVDKEKKIGPIWGMFSMLSSLLGWS